MGAAKMHFFSRFIEPVYFRAIFLGWPFLLQAGLALAPFGLGFLALKPQNCRLGWIENGSTLLLQIVAGEFINRPYGQVATIFEHGECWKGLAICDQFYVIVLKLLEHRQVVNCKRLSSSYLRFQTDHLWSRHRFVFTGSKVLAWNNTLYVDEIDGLVFVPVHICLVILTFAVANI